MRVSRVRLVAFTFLTAVTLMADGGSVVEEFNRSISPHDQAAFCSVLLRGVRAHESNNWLTLYEIVLPEHRGSSPTQFRKAQARRHLRIKRFNVTGIRTLIMPTDANRNGQWNVLGCALTQERGKVVPREAATTVYLDEGRWYIDTIGLLVDIDSSNPPRNCRMVEALSVKDLCRESDSGE